MDKPGFEEVLLNTIIPSNLAQEEQLKKTTALSSFVMSIMPSSLFKYRSCCDSHLEAFYNDEVWVSPAKNMNDGFDARIYFEREEIIRQISNEISIESISSFILSLQKKPELWPTIMRIPGGEDALLGLFSPQDYLKEGIIKANQLLTNETHSFIDFIHEATQMVTRICCFSETVQSTSMWGQYANNETGFCIEYEFKNNPNSYVTRNGSTISCMLYPVIYKNERFKVPNDYIKYLIYNRFYDLCGIRSKNQLSNLDIQRMKDKELVCPDIFMVTKVALHKSIEWQFEKEWRLISNDIDSLSFQNINAICFKKEPKALYLGRRITKVHEKCLKALAAEKGIPVYKMKLDDSDPKYELKYNKIEVL